MNEYRNDINDYSSLCGLVGEKEASELVIERLEKAIELIKKSEKGWPKIYSVDLPSDQRMHDNFIYSFSVTLSHPWPG